MKQKVKLSVLKVNSFITETSLNHIKAGGSSVKTIASYPVDDCKPVPTTGFAIRL